MPANMEPDLTAVVSHLARNRWPFRLHATYDETIGRALDVFEAVQSHVPFAGLRWFIDHAETISPANIERVKALGGGIAMQHRMAFQGEYFVDRYGARASRARAADPAHARAGPSGGRRHRRDACRQLQPVGLPSWLVTGKTLGGMSLYPRRIASTGWKRCACGRRPTPGSRARRQEGGHQAGQLADLAVLSADYFTSPRARSRTSSPC